ncbi:MAG: ABC transporter permease [Acidimicrobiales bacterium]
MIVDDQPEGPAGRVGTSSARHARRGGGLPGFVARRLLQALAAGIGASVVVWALLPLAPGDPAERVLRSRGVAEPTQEEIQATRAALGLDRPLIEQYGSWLGRAVRGDFSESYQTRKPVFGEIADRLPATLLLAVTATLLAIAVAVPAALIAAAFHGRWPDGLLRGFSLLGAGVPAFLLGLLVLYLVVLRLGLGQVLADGKLSQVWLPAAVLAFARAAEWSRLLRAGLLDALSSGYAAVATARGAGRTRVLVVHALPNASIPFLTTVGVGFGALVGGAPIIETVFSWPGVGNYVVGAINSRDMPVIQTFTALAAVVYVATSVLVDVTVAALHPQSRQRT